MGFVIRKGWAGQSSWGVVVMGYFRPARAPRLVGKSGGANPLFSFSANVRTVSMAVKYRRVIYLFCLIASII
jgi:hypothetical protein